MKALLTDNNKEASSNSLIIKDSQDIRKIDNLTKTLTFDFIDIKYKTQVEILDQIIRSISSRTHPSIMNVIFKGLDFSKEITHKAFEVITKLDRIDTLELSDCIDALSTPKFNYLSLISKSVKNFNFINNSMKLMATSGLKDLIGKENIENANIIIKAYNNPDFSVEALARNFLPLSELPGKLITVGVDGYNCNIKLLHKIESFLSSIFANSNGEVDFKYYQVFRIYQKHKPFVKALLGKEGESIIKKADEKIVNEIFTITGITKTSILLPEINKHIMTYLGEFSLWEIDSVIKPNLIGDVSPEGI